MTNKKAVGEIQYIVFVFVFIAVFTIIGALFLKNIIFTKIIGDISVSTQDNFWSNMIDSIRNIPLIGGIADVIFVGVSFAYVNPYLVILFSALIGPPLTYIILRLIRGGG